MAKKVDWEAVEKDYRAGQLSIRALAEKHGVSDTAIRKRANKHGWERDLSEKVRSRVKADVAKATANAPKDATEEEIVTAAAETGVQVVLQHRSQIALYRGIVERFGNRLQEQVATGQIDITDKTGAKVTIDVPLDYVGKALNSATASLERLVKLERQAFSLDDDGKEAETPESKLTDDELDSRIAQLLGKAGAAGAS